MSGERECLIGCPTTKAFGAVLIRSFSKVEALQIPKGREQRHKRKAKDRSVIALNPLEQVDAEAFDLVGPDALGHAGACKRHIALDGRRAQGPQSQAGV